MRIDRSAALPDIVRRRLLLGLGGSVAAAASPLVLVACGGSGGADAAPSPPPVGALHDAGRTFAGTQSMSSFDVDVSLPAGLSIAEGALAVHTLLGGFEPVVKGRAKARLLFAAPQWATLFTSDGLPLLFGFVGAGPSAISAHSTATVLLSMALGTDWSIGSTHQQWLAELGGHPACATLAETIAASLLADRTALATCQPAIVAATLAAVGQLLPAAALAARRQHALGVSVNPPDASSGAQPIIAAALNTVYLQNDKLRRAHHVIRREGHVDAAGDAVVDSGRPVLASGDIPLLPGFDSAASIIGDVTSAYYGGDSSSLAFSRTDDTALPVTPDDAKRTSYSVTVLTAGNAALGYDAAAFAALSDSERRMVDITLFAPENLALKQLFIDILVPLFLTWLGGQIGSEADALSPRAYKEKIEAALFGALLGTFQTTLPTIAGKLRDPKSNPGYGIGAALQEIVRDQLVVAVDVPVPGSDKPLTLPALSPFSIDMMLLLLKYLAYEHMTPAAGEALLSFLEGSTTAGGSADPVYGWKPIVAPDGTTLAKGSSITITKGSLATAGLGVATKCLGLVDSGLNLLAKSRMLADLASSRLVERWEVNSIRPKLRLNPKPFLVDGLAGTFPLTADIVDNDNDAYGVEVGSWKFHWVCTGRYGTLYKRNSTPDAAQESNDFFTSNANVTADYLPNGTTPDDAHPDTVTVTAIFEPVGTSKPSEAVGSVTTEVKFKKLFSLNISPPGPVDVPVDASMTVTAFLKETLPAGASVDWAWSHAGAGSITSLGADANPSDSAVSFMAPSSAGTATVTATATVTVPASGGAPPRVVITDPVSTTLNVKTGLEQVVMEVSGGIFACTDPLACGVTEYTAYIVPRLPKAVSYSAVLSGFTYGPCNRTITWSAPVGDGGGCNFPVTYHPHSSAGPTGAWAVWNGFGGALESGNRCVVTITLGA